MLPRNFAPPVTGLQATYFGDSGGATSRYYWVVARYAFGMSSIAGPVLVTTPAGLSAANRVLVNWNPMPGAISYDLLKTTTSTKPTITASILVKGLFWPNSFTDMGASDSLSTYDIAPSGLGYIQRATAVWDFAVDGGALGLITPVQNVTLPLGTVIVGGVVNVLAAATSTAAMSISIGTSAGSSTSSLLAATAKASLTLAAVINAVPVFATPVLLTAEGVVTFTTVTTAANAGKIQIDLLVILTQG